MQGLAFLPYFPLASGLLTGKYRRGEPAPEGSRLAGIPADRRGTVLSDDNMAVVERLTGFAERHGHSVLELAIAWTAAHGPVPSVIAGATSAAQVRANVAAGDWELTPEEVAEIDELAPMGPSAA